MNDSWKLTKKLIRQKVNLLPFQVKRKILIHFYCGLHFLGATVCVCVSIPGDLIPCSIVHLPVGRSRASWSIRTCWRNRDRYCRAEGRSDFPVEICTVLLWLRWSILFVFRVKWGYKDPLDLQGWRERAILAHL